MSPAVLFAGPTLPADTFTLPPDWVRLGPARQGDIWRAVRDHAPAAIGLIDGVFLDVPAVWHREILWALAEGVHVLGASSMGALRAAELAAFGMRGVGRIFEAYRDGKWPGFDGAFEDDDEVAIVHAPEAAGGAAVSDSMVDLRDTLLAAETHGLLSRPEVEALAAAMKRLHFPDRSLAALAAAADGMLSEAVAGRLRAWLPSGRVERKRLDAIELVRVMGDLVADQPPRFQAKFRFERALVWERFASAPPTRGPDVEMVLDELRLDPDAWQEARRAALGRVRALDAAEPANRADEQVAFGRLRRATGLMRRADIDAWLADNALGESGLARLVNDEARLHAAERDGTAHLLDAIADQLRLSGRFVRLRRRALAKQAVLSAATTSVDAPSSERRGALAGPHIDAALDWFIDQRLSLPSGTSAADAATAAGWSNEELFRRAIWHEYMFLRLSGGAAG